MTLIFPTDPDPTPGARMALASIKEGGSRPPDVASRVSTHLGLDPTIIQSIVLKGDISGLTGPQKVVYYNYRCFQCGLDPAAKPFDILKLNGREVLYANAAASQQLTQKHHLSHQITSKEKIDDIYLVSCRVIGEDGRFTENLGAVAIGGLKGEALANTYMKGTTKGIRRTVLTHCGLGMLDEDEVKTIPEAVTIKWDPSVIDGNPRSSILPGATPPSLKQESPRWTGADLQEFSRALSTLGVIAVECGLGKERLEEALAHYKSLCTEENEPSMVLDRINTYVTRVQAQSRNQNT